MFLGTLFADPYPSIQRMNLFIIENMLFRLIACYLSPYGLHNAHPQKFSFLTLHLHIHIRDFFGEGGQGVLEQHSIHTNEFVNCR